mgnify:CR=1 FL=1
MFTQEVTVNNEVGLHARPATYFIQKANEFKSSIWVEVEDRKINAQKFESAFYANPDLRSVRPPEEPKEPAPATLDLEALVEQLRKSPELANTLAALLVSAPSEK